VQKFSDALLDIDCVQDQPQRLLMLTNLHESRGQIAGESIFSIS